MLEPGSCGAVLASCRGGLIWPNNNDSVSIATVFPSPLQYCESIAFLQKVIATLLPFESRPPMPKDSSTKRVTLDALSAETGQCLNLGVGGAVIASATTQDLDPKGYKIAIESMDTPHQLLHPNFERWIKNEWISMKNPEQYCDSIAFRVEASSPEDSLVEKCTTGPP